MVQYELLVVCGEDDVRYITIEDVTMKELAMAIQDFAYPVIRILKKRLIDISSPLEPDAEKNWAFPFIEPKDSQN